MGENFEMILRSQKQWMLIIDAITDSIFVMDQERTLVKVNKTFATAIGRHPRDIVGHKIDEVYELEASDDETLKTVRDSGMPRIYEKKAGDTIYQISIFPLLEENQTLTIHVLKDITEVRRLKDQLYHSDKLASIGLLVSGVAHELNNPLTGAIAYTELLQMKVGDESIRADLGKILDSAERCRKIVENLLTFSRQRMPSRSLESINSIIDRAIDLRIYWLNSHNILIERDYDPTATVFVDAPQMQQVILNLLLNAEQALIASGRSDGKIRFITRSDKASRRFSIQVIDNGPGVPTKVAAKIFDPFFTTKPVGIGSGLGLSISHGIVSEHGGTIRFENAEGGGALFTIELPTGMDTLTGASGNGEGRQAR
jgi:PAS domain S-box-containing protein